MTESQFEALYAAAATTFHAGIHSIHGPSHWRRVEAAVIRMAPDSGCDRVVCRLFAIYHDACRLDDGTDQDHGSRAAAFLREVQGVHFQITGPQLDLLVCAVSGHTKGRTSTDPTIGTCWDADRLDLGRVGLTPNPAFMSTAIGKKLASAGGHANGFRQG